MLVEPVGHLFQREPDVLEADLLADDIERDGGKLECIDRISRVSPPCHRQRRASNTRSAGGRGLDDYRARVSIRCATTHFSVQVLTNRRYFCRLS